MELLNTSLKYSIEMLKSTNIFMRIFQQVQKQYDDEIRIVQELVSTYEVDIKVNDESMLAEEMLALHLDANEFNLAFFKKHVLGNNAQLITIEFERKMYLTVRVYSPDLNVFLYLPITNIRIKRDLDDLLGDGTLVTEKVGIDIEYMGMFWQGEGSYIDFGDKKSHQIKYTSKAKRTNHMSEDGSTISPGFVSRPDQIISKKSHQIAFQVALPISSESVIAQLHEQGHYYDLNIAGNSVHVTPGFRIMHALSSGLNFIPPSEPLNEGEIQSLVNLKSAEIRAWLYADYLLKRLGSEIDHVQTAICINSLKSYDRFLAPQVLSNGEFNAMLQHFMYRDVAEAQLTWMNAFRRLEQLVINIGNLGKQEYYLGNLDLSVNIYKSLHGNGIKIIGDDTELIFNIRDLKSANIVWISWSVNRDGQTIRENFEFHLNNSGELSRFGENVFYNWIDILEMIGDGLKSESS